jgi:GNAT superfamily N-acetyltransferase
VLLQYDAGEEHPAPWRITCFFVDRDHRRKGVALEALNGALDLIAEAGGGEVVSFPNIVEPGKRVSSSFLHNVTPGMFEEAGFTFERRIGKNKTVMRKVVAAV